MLRPRCSLAHPQKPRVYRFPRGTLAWPIRLSRCRMWPRARFLWVGGTTRRTWPHTSLPEKRPRRSCNSIRGTTPRLASCWRKRAMGCRCVTFGRSARSRRACSKRRRPRCRCLPKSTAFHGTTAFSIPRRRSRSYQFSAAADKYRQVAPGSKLHADAQLGLARVLRHLGNLEEALQALSSVSKLLAPAWGRDVGAEALI